MALISGAQPLRPFSLLNFSEQQRLYGYGRKQNLSEAETQTAYASGNLGTTRYQRGVVRGIASGARPIEHRGLFGRSAAQQNKAVRQANRFAPPGQQYTPAQVDAMMREGTFTPFARKSTDRAPARIIGRDEAYYRNVIGETGTAVGNALDDPATAQLRADAVNMARQFVEGERLNGNTKADENATVDRVMAMNPDQLRYYVSLTDEQRKDQARYAPVDLGGGTPVNMNWYHSK